MAEVTMSLEEYLQLVGGPSPLKDHFTPETKATKKKRVGKKDPKMARALKKANALGRKKSGGFKKGYSQARIMKKAHQLRRRMS